MATRTAVEGATGRAITPWWIRYTRWTQSSQEEGIHAERALLDLNGRNSIVQDDIKLPCGKKDRFIHTLTGGAVGKPVLVCTAGYGAGAGFWWKNYSFMTDHFRVHSVDMLGCGLSGRPDFTAKTTREAEAFFVESLEEWRQVMGLDKMILMGHSMGGYLMANYAMAYPERVQHLVMVGPAAVGRPPPPRKDVPLVLKFFRGLWDLGLTPGMVTRALGPVGPKIIEGYTSCEPSAIDPQPSTLNPQPSTLALKHQP
mmetsp:Transcript_64837/g.204717  ORF Transcript_64837/g.204717 Transcript_64837/m.204717 type:complete len:256 (+) Transcript_64837:76-843(+)